MTRLVPYSGSPPPRTAGALVVLLLLSMIVALVTRAIESDQDDRLLVQRANEVSLVLETSISSLETTMTGLGLVARDGGTALFVKEAARDVATGPGELTLALLRPEHGSYVVVVEAGHGLSAGEVAYRLWSGGPRARPTNLTTVAPRSSAHPGTSGAVRAKRSWRQARLWCSIPTAWSSGLALLYRTR
jgi:hypothetical protein